MNWDHKHSLSIQIERQRCNISCGPRRWKWFIFKDVAAYFHYFKVLLISMVLGMTNSHVQEEQAQGGCDFFVCQWRRSCLWPQNPEFYSGQAALHRPSNVSAGRTVVFDVECFSRPTQRVDSPSSPPSTSLQTHIYSMAALGPHRPPHQLLYWHLPEWRSPSAPWTKITPPLSSPRRAVIGKHLKYCDHLQ